MKLLRSLSLAITFLLPVAAIAAPPLTAACCDSGACCPNCPLCHHAG